MYLMNSLTTYPTPDEIANTKIHLIDIMKRFVDFKLNPNNIIVNHYNKFIENSLFSFPKIIIDTRNDFLLLLHQFVKHPLND